MCGMHKRICFRPAYILLVFTLEQFDFQSILFCFQTRLQSLKPNPNASYRNIMHAFRTIAAREGLYTSFRGINAVAAGAGPAHALYFSCYESMKKLFGSTKTSGHNPVAHGKFLTI